MKQKITLLAIGAIIALFVVHAIGFYQIKKQVDIHEKVLVDIVKLIQNNQPQAAPLTPEQ